MKGFDFPFTITKNPCDILLAMIQHFHKYSFQMRESHQTSALRAETSSRFQSDPINQSEPILTHRRQLSPTEEESDFLPLQVRLLAVCFFPRHVPGFLVQ